MRLCARAERGGGSRGGQAPGKLAPVHRRGALTAIPWTSKCAPRISLLIKNKKLPEARKAAEDAIVKAIASEDSITLSTLAAISGVKEDVV